MMKPLKAIVVEDERLPRLALLQKLEDFRSEVEVIDSCESYEDALCSIVKNRPDVLFLDIQLQGKDVIQLLNELKSSMELPHVIFTTAYADRRYLMSAIKLSAVDYLIKPVDKGELALAIAKLTKGCQNDDVAEGTGRIAFRTASGRLYIEQKDIAYIRADGNYVKVMMFDKLETVLESLSDLEKRLEPYQFVRTGRSTIINLKNLYKLNTKQKTCSLMSRKGDVVNVELSQNGVKQLTKLL